MTTDAILSPGGAGNYVKMIHNGIEYGDMQLIAETYDILKNVGGLSNDELAEVFGDWNKNELESFLIEITSTIFKKKDEDGESYVVDKVLDKTGMKGTGRWTVQEAAEQSVPCPTITAALDARYLSGLLDDRQKVAEVLTGEFFFFLAGCCCFSAAYPCLRCICLFSFCALVRTFLYVFFSVNTFLPRRCFDTPSLFDW